jgi:WD40 repeat protein
MYVRDVVELAAEERGTHQTPGLWPLPRHDRGEFLFHTPNVDVLIKEDPPLDYESNPWRGLRSYTKEEKGLFFGRSRVVDEIIERVQSPGSSLLAVVGASGSGKSSVVNAGVIPRIASGGDATANDEGIRVVFGPIRPAADPLAMLDRVRTRLFTGPSGVARLLVIDQFEEIFTMTSDPAVQEEFLSTLAEWTDGSDPSLQVLITLRADFEPQVRTSILGPQLLDGRYAIPPMTREEMREVIEGPAAHKVLYYEPPGLPDRLLDDLAAMPGALPLLSFTLAELYRRYIEQDERTDRALTAADYDAIGGVVGSLQTRASELHEELPPAEQRAMRNLMLRMVSDEGGDLAKRRLVEREQQWPDQEETDRVRTVRDSLIKARLLVGGVVDDDEGGHVPYVEPAHDMLVLSWDQIRQWQRDLTEPLKLRRELWQAAVAWDSDRLVGRRRRERLWHDDVRLPQVAANAHSADRWLNALEATFVDKSVKHKERRRQRLSIAVILIVGILLGITIYAVEKARLAGEKEDEARAALLRAEEKEDEAKESAASAIKSANLAKDKTIEANRQTKIAEDKTIEANRQTKIAEDKTIEAEVSARAAAASATKAKDAQSVAETALAETMANQARALTRLPGRGNEALAMAVNAAFEDARLRPGDTATAVLSEVLSTVRGPSLGDGHVSAVAMLGDAVVTGGHNGQVMAWAAGQWDRTEAPSPQHRAAITALAAQGEIVASGDATGNVYFWTLSDEAPTGLVSIGQARVGAAARHMQWGPQGLVIGSDDGFVTVTEPKKLAWSHLAMTRPMRSMAVSHEGRIAVGGEDGTVVIIEADGELASYSAHKGWVNSLHFAPNTSPAAPGGAPGLISAGPDVISAGPDLVSAGEDGTMRVWKGGHSALLAGHEGPVQSARFDPTGRYVASASWDGTLRIWSSGTREQLASLARHGDWVWSVDWTNSGESLITAGEDGSARLWSWTDEPRKLHATATLSGHDGWVRSARFTPDQRHAVTVGGDGVARLWSIEGGKSTPLGSVGNDLRRSGGGGSVIASLSDSGRGFVWRPGNDSAGLRKIEDASAVSLGPRGTPFFGTIGGDVLRVDERPEPIVPQLSMNGVTVTALEAEGSLIAVGTDQGKLSVWLDGETGPRLDLTGHKAEVYSISIHEDELLTVGRDRRVVHWSPRNTVHPTLIRSSAPPLTAALVSADHAIVGLESGRIESWSPAPDPADGWVCRQKSILLDAPVVEMSSSANGELVAAVSRDGAALVFVADTLAPLARFDNANIVSVLFDDSGVITVTREGTATRRPIGLGDYQELACSWLAQAAFDPAKDPCSRVQ